MKVREKGHFLCTHTQTKLPENFLWTHKKDLETTAEDFLLHLQSIFAQRPQKTTFVVFCELNSLKYSSVHVERSFDNAAESFLLHVQKFKV